MEAPYMAAAAIRSRISVQSARVTLVAPCTGGVALTFSISESPKWETCASNSLGGFQLVPREHRTTQPLAGDSSPRRPHASTASPRCGRGRLLCRRRRATSVAGRDHLEELRLDV